MTRSGDGWSSFVSTTIRTIGRADDRRDLELPREMVGGDAAGADLDVDPGIPRRRCEPRELGA